MTAKNTKTKKNRKKNKRKKKKTNKTKKKKRKKKNKTQKKKKKKPVFGNFDLAGVPGSIPQSSPRFAGSPWRSETQRRTCSVRLRGGIRGTKELEKSIKSPGNKRRSPAAGPSDLWGTSIGKKARTSETEASNESWSSKAGPKEAEKTRCQLNVRSGLPRKGIDRTRSATHW